MRFDLAQPAQLLGAFTPDLLLMGGAMVLLLVGVWRRESVRTARLLGGLSLLLCVATAVVVVWMMHAGASASPGPIAVDDFRWVSDLIVLLATAITIALAMDYARDEHLVLGETFVLILLSSGGMMILAAARDLIVVFLGIELMSIALYVLAGLDRRSDRSAEAALKYFLLGAFSTGFLLYGIALVYGATGTTALDAIGAAIAKGGGRESPMLVIGIGLIIVGFGFKVAAVPFHMWAPDVYEGAPTPVSAYMATAVKAAAFAALLRIWREAFPDAGTAWHLALWWLAAITMIGGNLIALAQKNLKRMLAYSSIAHAGYLLVAVVASNAAGTSAFLFYLVAYTLATTGAFAVVMAVGHGEQHQEMADFAGLWRVRPWLAVAMAVFMLALLGFPIFGGMGFFAKWYVIRAALAAVNPQTRLAVILVVASVISAGYYLAVVMAMFMRPRAEEAPAPRPIGRATALVIGGAAVVLLVLGVFPGSMAGVAERSLPALQGAAPPTRAVTALLHR